MKELSIFINESGDFGEYAAHSPYYIITMIFHDQSEDIQPAIAKLNQELSYLHLDNLCIHTGPIIRKEEIYEEMEIDERRRIFNKDDTDTSLVISSRSFHRNYLSPCRHSIGIATTCRLVVASGGCSKHP